MRDLNLVGDGKRVLTIAEEVDAEAICLGERISRLAEDMKEKLQPIMNEEPSQQVSSSEMQERSYPPLFDSLRQHFKLIERNIEKIEGLLERVEM